MTDTKLAGILPAAPETVLESTPLEEVPMVREDCWLSALSLYPVIRPSSLSCAGELDPE